MCFGFFSILVVLYRLALLWLSLGEPDWSVVWFGLLGVVFGLGLGSTGLISMFSIILNHPMKSHWYGCGLSQPHGGFMKSLYYL